MLSDELTDPWAVPDQSTIADEYRYRALIPALPI